ncbi:glycosyltransferase family 8 protein [Bipolaris maydis ATCC 48331]|uniref:glycogenin glucosyltransferase n=2 Tax=Cochliobolus heterostrophus TaxID=5016 RepID=M2TUR3_COCH5|nr:glycosyltransferase family 8 protein [Bipolaris maydis ATCC 48331]EMD90264.1 glycosyltransferase family 8 protein [Bipolaris maydis C5]ENI09522.1 glycosyltransferase family 8 protein [Bipolaris maydis ATCC 48331]KAJ6206181.1 glycosyltransferase family 8 protein [Bipolaris maydis]
MAESREDVYITLLMSDSYLPGAAVLAHSLRDAGTTKKLAVLITPETLSDETVEELKVLYDYVIPVERIRTANTANLYLMGRPDLAYTFTKIALWKQTQFRKLVYLDADVVALRALDELFDIEAPFAAAPDIGWPDAFNSGVMVIKPDLSVYEALQAMAAAGESFDGADQGLLNQYFEHRPWQRLKFTYNCTPNAEYQWEPAYRHYKNEIAAVHFIGKNKPWTGNHPGGSGVYGELVARWWAVHQKHFGDGQRAGTLANPWDPTKSGPPSQSKPEAANFPNQTYGFSDDPSLFRAPSAYPDAPKDMWYQVPETKPQPANLPPPIFPWEQAADRPQPTRVFAEDRSPEPTPAVELPTHPFSTTHFDGDDKTAAEAAKKEPSPERPSGQQWQSTTGNAWDNVPGIDNYVRAVSDLNGQRGKNAALQKTTGTDDIGSPTIERGRRESLIITDFPSAVERPSLPVTPAPVRRPMFWGDEKNKTGELPSATGVPDQTEWNPEEKLDQLRRSSLIEFEHLKKDEHPDPPLRELPEHSVGDAAKGPDASDVPVGEQVKV